MVNCRISSRLGPTVFDVGWASPPPHPRHKHTHTHIEGKRTRWSNAVTTTRWSNVKEKGQRDRTEWGKGGGARPGGRHEQETPTQVVIRRRWTGGTFPPPTPPRDRVVDMDKKHQHIKTMREAASRCWVSLDGATRVTGYTKNGTYPGVEEMGRVVVVLSVTRTRTPPPVRGHGQHTRHTYVIRVSGHRNRTVVTHPSHAGRRGTGQQGSTDTPKTTKYPSGMRWGWNWTTGSWNSSNAHF